MAPTQAAHTALRPLPGGFAALHGWAQDDHGAALDAFRRSARRHLTSPYKARALSGANWAERFTHACRAAWTDEALHDPRGFFERRFVPMRCETDGFVTAFFEPVVEARAAPDARFRHPLHAPPPDLVKLTAAHDRTGLSDPAMRFARAMPDGTVCDMPDRGAIRAGALEGKAPVLAWLDDPVSLFFIHVQGAARLRMGDGSERRVTFAAKTGHAYTSIARILCEREGIEPAAMTADVLAGRLRAMTEDERDALLARNRSYIFFSLSPACEEPGLGQVAAAGVPLTPLRSLAVDRTLHAFGTPFFVTVDDWPGRGARLARCLVAQDTGSAIVGPARGDVFVGTGTVAGTLAAVVRHPARLTALLPRDAAGEDAS